MQVSIFVFSSRIENLVYPHPFSNQLEFGLTNTGIHKVKSIKYFFLLCQHSMFCYDTPYIELYRNLGQTD